MPRPRLRSIRTILAIMLLGLSGATLAQQKPSCPPRPIVVGLYEFGHYYHAGSGLDKDIADQLAARSGCKFELRVMPRGYIWQELQAGKVDMTLSAAAPPERTVFAWAIPYIWTKNMVLLSKQVPPEVCSMQDFIAAPYLRLGMGRGYFAGTSYDGFITQLRNIGRVEDVDDAERLYAMFKAGRFQAMLSSQLVYSYYFKEGQFRIEDWTPADPREATNLLISKRNFSQEDSKRWGDLLKAMGDDGSILRLLERYVSAPEAARMLAP